ncbi:MAG: hypothetical protein HQL64_17215 [Magnetococcales bacterium]|nr:hypothetical protein [Magnetococcales bacterium]
MEKNTRRIRHGQAFQFSMVEPVVLADDLTEVQIKAFRLLAIRADAWVG